MIQDGGQATETALAGAHGAAIDRVRNVLYISDYNRIRRVDLTTGVITTAAGNGAATITNHGPDAASNVVLSLPVAGALTIAGATSSGTASCQIAASMVTCAVAAIAPGQQEVLTITGAAWSVTTLTATFTVTSQPFDPQPGNNSVTLEIEVEPVADLALSIVQPASGASVDLGATLDVEVAVTNLGHLAAAPIRVSLSIPAGLSFESGTIPGGSCGGSSGIVICESNGLPPNATVHAVLVLRATAVGAAAIAVDASSAGVDPDPTNNAVAIVVSVVQPVAIINVVEQIVVGDDTRVLPSMIDIVEQIAVADLPASEVSSPIDVAASKAIVMAAGIFETIVQTATVENGARVRFRLTASSVGVGSAGPITLTDVLPFGLSFAGGDPRCSPAGPVVTCVLTGLAPGAETSVDILAGVVPSFAPLGQTVTAANRISVSTADDANSTNDVSNRVFLTVANPDTLGPVLTLPSPITAAAANASGAVVAYIVSANDNRDGPVAVACTPASGSLFPIGTTAVTCIVFTTRNLALREEEESPMPKHGQSFIGRLAMAASLTLVLAGRASAEALVLSDLQLHLDLTNMVVSFTGRLGAQSSTGDPVFLDALSVELAHDGNPIDLFAGPTLLDDLPFFWLPLFLDDNQSLLTTTPLFNIAGLVPDATYTGSFSIFEFNQSAPLLSRQFAFTTSVPEPATLMLTGIGLGVAGALRRRRKSV